jgi:hypothetical protein
MTLRKHSPALAYTLAAVVLLPLACERVDAGKFDGRGGDGDGDLGGAGPTTGGAENGTGGIVVGAGGITQPATGGTTNEVVLPNPLLDYCYSMGGMGGMPSSGSADGDLLIDDFEDGDNRVFGNGLSGRWESHNDGTEGGTQSPVGGFRTPEATWTDDAFDEGRDGSESSLHMTGAGFATWGSGQALYLAQGNNGLACLFDGSEYAGITFWARGHVTPDSTDVLKQPRKLEEVGKMRVKVVDLDVIANGGDELEPGATAGGRCDQENYSCWDSPLTRIELHEDADCWQKYVLPFSEMLADEWSKWRGVGITTLDASEIFQIAFEVSEKQSYEIWIDDIEFYTADDVPDEVLGCN